MSVDNMAALGSRLRAGRGGLPGVGATPTGASPGVRSRAGRSLKPGVVLLLLLAIVSGCGLSKDPAHVILITMDTTRADRLGCYGCSFASTPALDSISAKATLFENAISAVPITLPSHMTMMTGRSPLGHGVRNNGWRGGESAPTTLAEMLSAQGYHTAAFVGSQVLRDQTDVARGFQHYDDEFFADRADAETTDRAIAYLEQRPSGPLFLWVHYFDPHDPYTPAEPFASTTLGQPYDAEVSAMDHGIGRLMAALDRLGVAKNAHIILVADHGEGLGDRAGYMDHGLLLYEEADRVPFLWHTPGQTSGRRDPSLVGCVDILATVLDMLGIDGSVETDGISLRSQLEGRRPARRAGLYCETAAPYLFFRWSPLYGWRTATHKYIVGSERELYDLRTDPGELNNIASIQPALADSLHEELLARMQVLEPDPASFQGPEDEHEREVLESLGYLQPSSRGAERPGVPSFPRIGELDGLASPRDHIAYEQNFTAVFFAHRAENWQAVIDNYEIVLAGIPESPAVPLGLAEALVEVGRFREAVTWLERHFAFRPGDPDAQRLYGDALVGVGRYREASRAYAQVADGAQDVDLLLADVRVAVMSGDPQGARQAVGALQKLFPRHPKCRAWVGAVETLARLGTQSPAAADEDYGRQVRALLSLGLLPQAQALRTAGARARPGSVMVRLDGDLAFAAGKWCDAAEAYAHAAQLRGDTPGGPRYVNAQRRCQQATRAQERSDARSSNPVEESEPASPALPRAGQ